MPLLQSLIDEAQRLPTIPMGTVKRHASSLQAMTQDVDDALCAMTEIGSLIGYNPLGMMTENHRHHGLFMATVFRFGLYELLARTIPWVYRAYGNHNFTYDYFPVELKAWKHSVLSHLGETDGAPIQTVYDWMLSNHEHMIALATSDTRLSPPIPIALIQAKEHYLEALLKGNSSRCLDIAKQNVLTKDDLENFYIHVLQPSMYEIGVLWEKGIITVAAEHLATSITGRVISTVYSSLSMPPARRGKAVITSAPNERHEMGAWMVSDLLEVKGWHVTYLGAGTPLPDLLQCLKEKAPDLLMISVTMPFHIYHVEQIISEVQKDPTLQHIKTMVGGYALKQSPNTWKATGADGWASSADEAVQLAEQWFSPGESR